MRSSLLFAHWKFFVFLFFLIHPPSFTSCFEHLSSANSTRLCPLVFATADGSGADKSKSMTGCGSDARGLAWSHPTGTDARTVLSPPPPRKKKSQYHQLSPAKRRRWRGRWKRFDWGEEGSFNEKRGGRVGRIEHFPDYFQVMHQRSCLRSFGAVESKWLLVFFDTVSGQDVEALPACVVSSYCKGVSEVAFVFKLMPVWHLVHPFVVMCWLMFVVISFPTNMQHSQRRGQESLIGFFGPGGHKESCMRSVLNAHGWTVRNLRSRRACKHGV